MASGNDEAKRKFAEGLNALIRAYDNHMSSEEMGDALSDALDTLGVARTGGDGEGSLEFTCELDAGSDRRLICTFPTPASLRAQIEPLTRTQALCVKLDTPPPMMADVEIIARAGHVGEHTLAGRVVHVGEEVALQIFSTPADADALTALADTLEHAPPPEPEPAPQQQVLESSSALTLEGVEFSEAQLQAALAHIKAQSSPSSPAPRQQRRDPRQDATAERHDLTQASASRLMADLAREGVSGTIELEGRGVSYLSLIHI